MDREEPGFSGATNMDPANLAAKGLSELDLNGGEL